MIYGSEEPVDEAGAEYDAFLGLADRASTPVFCAPGNHEIYDRPEMETLYQSRMGRLYGSFDFGHTHVIALDTEEIGSHGGIGPEQMDWLKQDLAANRQAKNIFVFNLLCEVNGNTITVKVLQPWRLFASVEANASGGFTSALLSNYDDCDLPMYIDLPAPAASPLSRLSAACTYKGKTQLLAIAVAPSSRTDTTTLRILVPKARSAKIIVKPNLSQ
jgi:hypothetical protein